MKKKTDPEMDNAVLYGRKNRDLEKDELPLEFPDDVKRQESGDEEEDGVEKEDSTE